MINGGIDAKLQRKLDSDAHLGENCTSISGRKNPTLKKKGYNPLQKTLENTTCIGNQHCTNC